MKITKKFLEDFGACETQTKRFLQLFPNGCQPTALNLAILANTTYRQGSWNAFLSINWLGKQLALIDIHKYDQWERYVEAIEDNLEGLGTDTCYAEADVAVLSVLLSKVTQEQVNKATAYLKRLEEKEINLGATSYIA